MADEHPACENCRWWDSSTQLATAQKDTTGQCRVMAPTMHPMTGEAAWPFTEDQDWCGKFKPQEADDA